MRDVYATTFSFRSRGDPDHGYLRGIEAVRLWAGRKLAMGRLLPDTDRGHEETSWAGADWSTEAVPGDPRRLWQLLLRDRSADDPTLVWRTSVQVSSRPEGSRFTLRLAVESVDARIAPVHYTVWRPNVVRMVAESPGGAVDGWDLVPEARQCRSDDVGALTQLILSPTRLLPVIVLTPEDASGRPALDPDLLADRILGLAHVVHIPVRVATYELTNAVGSMRSVFGGAVRLYWPGFALDSNPFEHPLWLPDKIHAFESIGRPLEKHIQAIIASVAVLRVPPDPLARELRPLADAAARQRADAAAVALERRVRDEADTTWFTELEQIDTRRRELEDEVRSLRARNEALEDENESLQQNFAVVTAATAARRDVVAEDILESVEAESPPDSVVEAVERARVRCQRVVILDDAIVGARRSGYRQPEKVLDALMALEDMARAWAADALPRGFRGFLEERNLWRVYHDDVTTEAVAKHPAYTQRYKGDDHVLGPHFALGKGTSADNICRIYWFQLDDEKAFVVGHVGRHLRDRTT